MGVFVDYYLKLILLFLSVAVIITCICLAVSIESQISDRGALYKKYADGYDSSQYIYACATNCNTTVANNTVNNESIWIDRVNYDPETKTWKKQIIETPKYNEKGEPIIDSNGNVETERVVLRTTYQSAQISAYDGTTGINQRNLYDQSFPGAPSPTYLGDYYETPVTFTDSNGQERPYSYYNDWLVENYCGDEAKSKYCEALKTKPFIGRNSDLTGYSGVIVYEINDVNTVVTLGDCNPKWGTDVDQATRKLGAGESENVAAKDKETAKSNTWSSNSNCA